MNFDALSEKKQRLDQYRPLPKELVNNLSHWFEIELTYTSNAIEGNTLTRQETSVVLEKGITVGGKTLKEHLEATNHQKALIFLYSMLDKKPKDIRESDILAVHKIILTGIDDENAGRYRRVPVRIAGSATILPNHAKVPQLMSEMVAQLSESPERHPVHLAADAHYQLVTIHPFIDGNGRTGRLLMNLILMQLGYPPGMIGPDERLAYIKSLEKAQTGGPMDDYYQIIADAVDRSLDIYLKAAESL